MAYLSGIELFSTHIYMEERKRHMEIESEKKPYAKETPINPWLFLLQYFKKKEVQPQAAQEVTQPEGLKNAERTPTPKPESEALPIKVKAISQAEIRENCIKEFGPINLKAIEKELQLQEEPENKTACIAYASLNSPSSLQNQLICHPTELMGDRSSGRKKQLQVPYYKGECIRGSLKEYNLAFNECFSNAFSKIYNEQRAKGLSEDAAEVFAADSARTRAKAYAEEKVNGNKLTFRPIERCKTPSELQMMQKILIERSKPATANAYSQTGE